MNWKPMASPFSLNMGGIRKILIRVFAKAIIEQLVIILGRGIPKPGYFSGATEHYEAGSCLKGGVGSEK
jgi:hypothetical protein